MEPYYEINVAKKLPGERGQLYVHFFATAPRSFIDGADARRAYEIFLKKFPEPDYKISMSYWQCTGTKMLEGAG